MIGVQLMLLIIQLIAYHVIIRSLEQLTVNRH